MAHTTSLIILILPILAAKLHLTYASYNCDDIKKCKCETSDKRMELKCLQNGTLISVEHLSDTNALTISCTQPFHNASLNHVAQSSLEVSVYGVLPELNLDVLNSFTLDSCPLPTRSFKELFNILNVTKVHILSIKHSNYHIKALGPPYLDDLPFLTELSISVDKSLTGLHTDLLRGTPRLKQLFLRGNALHDLSPGVLIHVPYLRVLDLGSNNISYLSPGVFKNLSFLRELNIDNNRLITIDRSLFKDTPNLISLDISGNKFTELPYDVFADLSKLEKFQANKNLLKTLPKDIFSNVKNLKVVKILYHAKTLTELPPGLFANLPKLTDVIICDSRIHFLPADLFWNSTNLTSISLTGHKHLNNSLPIDLFRDNRFLQNLDLSNNAIKYLPEKVFTNLEKLNQLKMNKNKLQNITNNMFHGLSKLKYLDMSHNNLSHISPFSFEHFMELKSLDLSDNRLLLDTEFIPWKNNLKLEKIDLSKNNITVLSYDWLVSMENLKQLDLHNNNLENISNVFGYIISNGITINFSSNNISYVNLNSLELFASNSQGSTTNIPKVIMTDNPVKCDCLNYDLIRYVTMKMLPSVYKSFQIETEDLACVETGQKIQDVSLQNISCTLPNCSSQCSCRHWPGYSRVQVLCNWDGIKVLPELPPIVLNDNDLKEVHLSLRRNFIERLPDEVPEGYDKITYLDLSYNALSDIKVYPYFRQLRKLDLSNNKLRSLDEHFVQYLSTSSYLKKSSVSLSNNPWQCNCGISPLSSFVLNNHEKILDSENVICQTRIIPLNKMSYEEYCPSFADTLVAGSIFLGTFGFFFSIVVLTYYRYKHEIKVWLFAHRAFLWFVTEEELDGDKKYDVFVSYATEDEPFVEDKLITGLEKNYFKVCYHMRDWTPGEWIHNQIIKSVEESRRTLIVLSKHFLKSEWGKVEFRTAHCKAVRENRARVIILVYGDEPAQEELDSDMKAYMSMNTYIKWGDPWFWEKLKNALPHPPSKPVNKIEMDSNSFHVFNLDEKQIHSIT